MYENCENLIAKIVVRPHSLVFAPPASIVASPLDPIGENPSPARRPQNLGSSAFDFIVDLLLTYFLHIMMTNAQFNIVFIDFFYVILSEVQR